MYVTFEQLKDRWKCTDFDVFRAVKDGGLQAFDFNLNEVDAIRILPTNEAARIKNQQVFERTKDSKFQKASMLFFGRKIGLPECIFRSENVMQCFPEATPNPTAKTAILALTSSTELSSSDFVHGAVPEIDKIAKEFSVCHDTLRK